MIKYSHCFFIERIYHMNVLNRPNIKFEARNFISIDRRWFKIFLAGIVPILVDLCNSSINYYSKSDYYSSNPLFNNFSRLIALAYILIFPITISLCGYRLNCLRNNEFNSKYVYSTAGSNYTKFLMTEFIRGIIIFLYSLLLIIPGIIKLIAYSMTGFIICDNPNLSSKDAIDLSNRITYGFKKDIFFMYLSFIPWFFIVGVTFGLASLYVKPYFGITEAMFYENIKKHAIETGVASPNEFGIY
ncbi:MAG: DUF975 family protein [Clostridia bacterium]|nr:DUF975 family protein [Clostridia bacterium]